MMYRVLAEGKHDSRVHKSECVCMGFHFAVQVSLSVSPRMEYD